MQPQRRAMTDCLADLIHIIRMGEKSGVLTVERGEGRSLEEGLIIFVKGQVVEARVNSGAVFPHLPISIHGRYFLFSLFPKPLTKPSPPPQLPHPLLPLI